MDQIHAKEGTMTRLILIIFFVISCVPYTGDFNQVQRAGFKKFDIAFEKIPDREAGMNLTIPVNAQIHIVRDSTKLPDWCRAYGFGACCTPGHVYVVGKVLNGKIVINQAILGHEVHHLLNFENEYVADPDTLY